jgi:cell wall integrity and stress response component
VLTGEQNDDGVSPTPGPTVHTVTVSGVIKTVTTTPTPTPGDGSAALATSQQSKGLSTGATVGIAIGVVGIVVVAGIFLFMYYMKRKRRDAEDGLFTASRRGSSPGMLSTPKTGEASENRFADIPNPGPVWDVSSANAKRRSHLMPIDPRLDPFAKGIYVRDQNKSHDSIGSLQDNQDYSRRIQEPPRVLRAVNPDPDD